MRCPAEATTNEPRENISENWTSAMRICIERCFNFEPHGADAGPSWLSPPQAAAYSRLARRAPEVQQKPGTNHTYWCRVADPPAGWGRVTHNTGNHRAPSPSPPLRHTDENDGDDVVHNDVDVLFPAWLLVVPLLLRCSGLRHCMVIALFS